MRVLVLGITGFLGLNLAEELIKSGYEVIGASRGFRKNGIERIRGLGIKHAVVDLTSGYGLEDALRNVDAVIHLVSPPPFGVSKAEREKGHIIATDNLIKAMRKHDVERLIFASICEMYSKHYEEPITEEEPEDPMWEHGIYKLRAEEMIKRSGLKYTILRMSILFGPWQYGQGFIALIDGIYNDKFWSKVGLKIDALIQPAYSRDVAKAYVKALESDMAINKTYNLAGEVLEYSEFIRSIYRRLGRRGPRLRVGPNTAKIALNLARIVGLKTPLLHSDIINILLLKNVYSVKRAMSELNYKITPFDEALEETIEWYKNHYIKESVVDDKWKPYSRH